MLAFPSQLLHLICNSFTSFIVGFFIVQNENIQNGREELPWEHTFYSTYFLGIKNLQAFHSKNFTLREVFKMISN